MPLDKALQTGRNVVPSPVTAVQQFGGDIFGDIAGPTFRGVEAHHPNRIVVLGVEQIGDDGFKVCGGLEVGLPAATTEITKIIGYQIDGFTVATGVYGGGPTSHYATAVLQYPEDG